MRPEDVSKKERQLDLGLFSDDKEEKPHTGRGRPRRRGRGESFLQIPVTDIDLTDRRYLESQTRDLTALRNSIRREGQRTPVILTGRVPYTIVCGYSRIAAIVELGKNIVNAVVLPHLSESDAQMLAITDNLTSRGDVSSDLDRIKAARMLYDLGMNNSQIGSVLGVGTRCVQRYRKLFDAPGELLEMVKEGRITKSAAYEIFSRGMNPSDFKVKRSSVRQIQGKATGRTNGEKAGDKSDAFRLRPYKTGGGFHLSVTYKPGRTDKKPIIQELEKLLKELREQG